MFASIRAAISSALGYGDVELVDAIFAKSLALTDQDIRDMPASSGLDRTALAIAVAALACRPPLRVLDFGGAFAMHYRVARLALPDVAVKWAVVEMPPVVKRAVRLETETLRWFSDVAGAAGWLGQVDIVHSFGALQYTDQPDAFVAELLALRAPVVLWSKLALTDGAKRRTLQVSRLAENGPGPLPPGFEDREIQHEITELNRDWFLSAHEGYHVAVAFNEMFPGFLFRRA
jgi:putative methyltransferase (TIGR04325 family)